MRSVLSVSIMTFSKMKTLTNAHTTLCSFMRAKNMTLTFHGHRMYTGAFVADLVPHTKLNNTVVPRYNDHLYNGNFDFRRNFIGNRSFLIKLYYIITEFALFDTDGDSSDDLHFFTHFWFNKTTEKSSDKFTDKNIQPAVDRYAHCCKWLQVKQGRLVSQWPCI